MEIKAETLKDLSIELNNAVIAQDYDAIINIANENNKTDNIIKMLYDIRISPENYVKDDKTAKKIKKIVTDIVINKTQNWIPFPKEYAESYGKYVLDNNDTKRHFMYAKHIILTLLYLSGINKRKAGFLVGKSSGHTSTIYAMGKIEGSMKYETNIACAFIECFYCVRNELIKQKLI